MAKTESTAVNELIGLVQSGKPQADEPEADLFSAPAPSARLSSPRTTAPVPALRGAGEVAPLPRGRAPHNTSQQGVRMSNATPSRGNTIPSLASPQPRGATIPPPRKT